MIATSRPKHCTYWSCFSTPYLSSLFVVYPVRVLINDFFFRKQEMRRLSFLNSSNIIGKYMSLI